MDFKLFLEGVTTWAYHVTYYHNLESISENGLNYKEFGGRNFEKPFLIRHSQTGNFFTLSLYGAREWISTLEEMANDRSDNPIEEGYIPVILKFKLNRNKQIPDRYGGENDRKTTSEINQNGLWVWSGRAWLPISEWDRVDVSAFMNGEQVRDAYAPPPTGYPLPSS